MGRQPNIIVFQTDDHAQWASSVYDNDQYPTPHLDRLAQRGIVMNNAFTTTPVCSPARASFFTGLLPSQHGVRDFISSQPQFHDKDWLAGLDTLPEQLSRAGYTCGLAGKWHIGRDMTPARGFDHWRAMSGGYPTFHQGKQSTSHDGEMVETDAVLTDLITDNALSILEDRKRDQPFFLYVGYYGTHSPWSGQPETLVPIDEPLVPLEPAPEGYCVLNVELRDATEQTAREARAQYRAAVANIDAGVGRILAALNEDEDTIVVYTADHGLSLGQNGLFGKGNATYPMNFGLPHMRIPMILSRPGIWAEGQRSTALADLTDLYATLKMATGLDALESDELPRPGADLIDIIKGNAPAKTHQISEYGPAAWCFDGQESVEWHSGETALDSETAQPLRDHYAALGCTPPWEWTPPSDYLCNPTDVWRRPRTAAS